MERIVLKHLSGSKANQVEEFPLAHVRELVFGRDPSATVKYDPDRDDLVGRQHARIAQDPADPSQFVITDLNSRNGTFLNRQRVNGTARINVGDVVQFGPGGPEFVFEVEPRPANATKPTRSASAALPPTVQASTSPVPQTRVGGSGGMMPPPPPAPTGSVGRNTVMRMIDENVTQAKKQQGRRYALFGTAAFLMLAVAVAGIGGFLWWRSRSSDTAREAEISGLKTDLAAKEAAATLAPNVIAKDNRNAVVKIEVAWRLISPTGGLVYHQYLRDPDGRGPLAAPPGSAYAVYIRLPDSTIEPLLTYDGNPFSVAIGGEHSGTGFAVSSDGFILTNRHVAASWETTYDFPDTAKQGVLLDINGNFLEVVKGVPEWVPSKTKQTKILQQGRFHGRNDRLAVAFPGSENRIAAQLVQSSPRHDVAMIKISVPDPTPKVEIFDNYDAIQPGDSAIVLGYPSVSPPVFGIVKSQDYFNRQTQIEEIPDPTLSVGNIGRVLRDREATGGKMGQVSYFGDVYQLTINSTGAGNSGGPVFDGRGRVTGILFASRRTDAAITFAVPIRYGKELMSVSGGR